MYATPTGLKATRKKEDSCEIYLLLYPQHIVGAQ